jgi:iron complex outermembrane receptor protein
MPFMTRSLARSALALSILAALAAPAFAADATHPHTTQTARDEARQLDEVKVTASPLDTALDELARPADVLTGLALDERRAGTLGETVASLPGVQSSHFGPGVGRPIIRGLDGARVQVLANGLSSLDVSTVSVDHAVSIEPFLADSIEVLKGPANLFFGNGAIGGAVNVVDGRIPTERAERLVTGRAELRGGTGNDEKAGLFRVDGGGGNWAWHVDGLVRNTADIDIAGFVYSADLRAEEIEEGEDPSEFESGTLENSATRSRATSGGIAYLGDRVFFGGALSNYGTDYGIPGGHSHEEEGGEEEEGGVRIELDQNRSDLRFGINDLGPLKQVAVNATFNDYEHVEFEGPEVGTRFINEATEARLEAVQNEIWGWNGAIGLQYGDRDFEAIGDEAFVPPSTSRDRGIFVMQEREFGTFKLELGARHDRIDVALTDGLLERDFDTTSGSIGLRWAPAELWHLTLNLDHAERAPSPEELFAEGTHIATSTYEIGDPFLDTETADRAELGVHLHGERFEGRAAIYQTRFDNFIYLAETGLEIDDLPVRLWTQADADFRGWEIEGTVTLAEAANGTWTLRGFADGVTGELDAGGNLPRIAPGRFGLDLGWSLDAWRAGLGAVRYQSQDDVAEGETRTAGYTLVNAQVAYHWDTQTFGWEAYLQGSNLTDEEARVHTSFLKDVAPLMGRNVTAGLRVFF